MDLVSTVRTAHWYDPVHSQFGWTRIAPSGTFFPSITHLKLYIPSRRLTAKDKWTYENRLLLTLVEKTNAYPMLERVSVYFAFEEKAQGGGDVVWLREFFRLFRFEKRDGEGRVWRVWVDVYFDPTVTVW